MTNNCTCWLGTDSTFGDSEKRKACAVHGDSAPSLPPVEAKLPAWVEVQAGNELKHLVEVVRFAPGQHTGFLHSASEAGQLLWRWFLRWHEAAAIPHPQTWQPEWEHRKSDVLILKSIAELLARDSIEGLNLPGVGRAIQRVCEFAESVASLRGGPQELDK